ncbi:MAG: radical SAM protein, partial [Ignisphaera sp.]
SVGAKEVPSIDEIPLIKAPSVNGLIEITRGCPRGCKFCSVTLRPLRHIPIDRIIKEIDINISYGIKHIVLHSEDVLLYGASGIEPNPDAVLKLHLEIAKKARGIDSMSWAHASLAAIVYSQRKYKLITNVSNIIYSDIGQKYLGVEVGIETGSPRMTKIIMPAKAAPFKPEEWPNIVEEAFAIMHEHRIVPAATFILGFPGEEPDDVLKTVELLDRLKNYRSIIVPMIFVPMGALKSSEGGITGLKFSVEHAEAMRVAFWHTIKWAEDIMNNFYLNKRIYAPLRLLLKAFMWYAKQKVSKVEKTMLPRLETRELSLLSLESKDTSVFSCME